MLVILVLCCYLIIVCFDFIVVCVLGCLACLLLSCGFILLFCLAVGGGFVGVLFVLGWWAVVGLYLVT